MSRGTFSDGDAVERRIRGGVSPSAGVIDAVVADDGLRLGRLGTTRRVAHLRSGLIGFGPLEPLVGDSEVTDVLVNGDGAVWVDRGDGVARDPVIALDGPVEVRRLATRLAALAGRRLDDAQPWVDGLLPRGVRLHAILPPLVNDGAHISLRVPRHRGGGLDELARLGMLDHRQVEQVRAIVQQRRAYVVTGGTGTGKTTLLGAMLAEIPGSERVVIVEDVAEIGVEHPHVVRLQARQANTEGAGLVSMVDLVRQALRMRPDRLVVGEVRGPEVRDLLLALNTGHEGGCGTVHANRAKDVPARFEALGALAGMSREAVQAQLIGAISVIIHLRRVAGRRIVESITDLDGRPLPEVSPS